MLVCFLQKLFLTANHTKYANEKNPLSIFAYLACFAVQSVPAGFQNGGHAGENSRPRTAMKSEFFSNAKGRVSD
jgi:hypothetical protein